jgi:hypothetical protein
MKKLSDIFNNGQGARFNLDFVGAEYEFPPETVSPSPAFTAKDGVLLSRLSYPKLWEKIRTGALPSTTEADWLTQQSANVNNFVSTYSIGNGLTTFRVPSVGTGAGIYPDDIYARVFIYNGNNVAGIPDPEPDWLTQQGVNASEIASNANDILNNKAIMESYVIGVPMPWPLSTPPSWALEVRGQEFNKMTFLLLALLYPSGVLPDLRGEFIRGWDNGRGIDLGRAILSWQEDAFESHSHNSTWFTGGRSDYWDPTSGSTSNSVGPVASSLTGENENRPRNLAFMFIVRAA